MGPVGVKCKGSMALLAVVGVCSVLEPVDRLKLGAERSEGELAIRRGTSRHTLVFGRSGADLDHDAAMRIGGEAPGRRAHSLRRRASRACLGSPPPRIVIDGSPAKCRRAPKACARNSPLVAGCSRSRTQDDALRDLAGRHQLPQRDQQLAREGDNHGLAGCAPGIGGARPIPPACAGAGYWASALSFWNIRKRQASWIMPRRTRALPALASPLSRRRAPLSSGAPVRPA